MKEQSMTTNEIKRSADLTNGGVLRNVYVSPEQAAELQAAGYRVIGRDVYVPRWVGERPVLAPVDRTPAEDHDWEGAILARDTVPW